MDVCEANNRTRSGTYLHRSNVYDSLFVERNRREGYLLPYAFSLFIDSELRESERVAPVPNRDPPTKLPNNLIGCV